MRAHVYFERQRFLSCQRQLGRGKTIFTTTLQYSRLSIHVCTLAARGSQQGALYGQYLVSGASRGSIYGYTILHFSTAAQLAPPFPAL